MTDDAATGPAHQRPANGGGPGGGAQARFEFVPADDREPVTVRAAGDIDLTNVGEFQAVLHHAAAVSGAFTADMTAVTYCDSAAVRALLIAAGQAQLTIQVSTAGPVTETLLKVSGLDQIAIVVTAA